MARGAPDWTQKIEVTINSGQPQVEAAAGAAAALTTVSTSYQDVASWTVAAGKVGELKEILVLSSNYAKTLCKVVIGAVTYVTDWAPQSALPLIFEDLRLAAATVVTVSGKSSDGTSVVIDAAIVGKEVG